MSRPRYYRQTRHEDRIRYIVYVLWMIGHSQRAIAAALGLRTKQVAGLIHRSDYQNRAAMSDAEIASKLQDLEAIRFDDQGIPLDGGI